MLNSIITLYRIRFVVLALSMKISDRKNKTHLYYIYSIRIYSYIISLFLSLQHHPSLEDVLIVQENEYCQSGRITIFIGVIYAYKGLLLVSLSD